MPNEVVRWRSSSRSVERQHSQQLSTFDNRVEMADAQVAGINQVARRALVETMQTHMVKKQAEQLAPDGAELYTMIAVAGAMASSEVIYGLSRRWSR